MFSFGFVEMDTEDIKTKQVPHQIALENLPLWDSRAHQTWFMLILFFSQWTRTITFLVLGDDREIKPRAREQTTMKMASFKIQSCESAFTAFSLRYLNRNAEEISKIRTGINSSFTFMWISQQWIPLHVHSRRQSYKRFALKAILITTVYMYLDKHFFDWHFWVAKGFCLIFILIAIMRLVFVQT